jgi:hypothetical protein
MTRSIKKPTRRILGFKEWLKATAQKQVAEGDKGSKTATKAKKPVI